MKKSTVFAFLQQSLSQAVARGVVKAIKSGCKTIAFTV
jgi:hypothetical protein